MNNGEVTTRELFKYSRFRLSVEAITFSISSPPCIPLNGQISITSNIFNHLYCMKSLRQKIKLISLLTLAEINEFHVNGTHIVVYTAFRSPFSIAALFDSEALEPHWNSIQTPDYVAVLIRSFYGKITSFIFFIQNREKNYCAAKKKICQVQPSLKNSKGATITHIIHIEHYAAFTMWSEQLVDCKRTANHMKCQNICSQRRVYRTSSALVVNIGYYQYRTHKSQ